MILGDVCSRTCRFCATTTGNPGGRVDENEPQRVADFVQAMSASYIVITSVTRDDLPDGGADIYARVIGKLREADRPVKIEVLIPDFAGSRTAIEKVVKARPDVMGHNIETVRRLSRYVRDIRASYEGSLRVLKIARQLGSQLLTKSGLMLGLGEDENDVIAAMEDLRNQDVDALTLGQYLSPSPDHLPVTRYITPREFNRYEEIGYNMGFKLVHSGPLVRSSYHAAEITNKIH